MYMVFCFFTCPALIYWFDLSTWPLVVMAPISGQTLEPLSSRRYGGPHNLSTPQAYGSIHLRIFMESKPPSLPSVVSRRNKREKKKKKTHSIISFPSEFAGGNTTRSRVFSSPRRGSRRRRRSSSGKTLSSLTIFFLSSRDTESRVFAPSHFPQKTKP